MTQTATCVALQPLHETELAQHIESPSSAIAQTSDRFSSDLAEALLPVEEIAITSAELTQHREQPNTTVPFKFDDAILAGFRIGYRQDAAATADKTLAAGATATQEILQIAEWVQEMKMRLNRKEFSRFVKNLLQWVGDEARKYLDIARAFDGFDLSRLQHLEPFTILKLRSKKYAPIIERLRESAYITPNLIQELIKELLPKPTRKNSKEQISGWKQARFGGGRYYNLLLHDEETGLSIEQQAEIEGILPQKVIAEAVALRAQHKSDSLQPSRDYATPPEEVDAVVDDVQLLFTQNSSQGKELPKGEDEIASSVLSEALETQVEGIALEQKTFYLKQDAESAHLVEKQEDAQNLGAKYSSVLQPGDLVEINATSDKTWNGLSGYVQKLVTATGKAVVLLQGYYRSKHFFLNELKLVQEDFSDAMQARVPQKELVEEASTTTMTQDAVAQEPAESSTTSPHDTISSEPVDPAVQPEASLGATVAKCQEITPPWEKLKQLRDAEGYVQTIDTQLQELNSKLAKPSLDRIVERELKDVLKNRQNLRLTKISQLVNLADSNGIPADYEQLRDQGRVVLDLKYASVAILQAKSWAEVVLVVRGSSIQLIKAIQSWSMESKQLLAQLLSEYLEEPNAFEQIDWIPEDLLLLALAKLSFQLQRFKKSDNLVDEPEIKYLTGCQLSSFSHLGTRREQWVFLFEGNLIPVFGRDEILVEKF